MPIQLMKNYLLHDCMNHLQKHTKEIIEESLQLYSTGILEYYPQLIPFSGITFL